MDAHDLANRPHASDVGGGDALSPTSRITLTEEQELGRTRGVRLLRGRAKYNGRDQGRVTGSAGSGKTTVTRTILDDLEAEGCMFMPPGGWAEGEEPGEFDCERVVALVAPTNRAARRASQVTGRSWSTIHRFAFRPEEAITGKGREIVAALAAVGASGGEALARGDQAAVDGASREAALLRIRLRQERRVMWMPNPGAGRADSILADEGSMVGARLWSDVPARPTLMLGDPFQLPPVQDTPLWESWPVLSHLRQVHRHGGPIKAFCDALRRGEAPYGLTGMDTGTGGPLRVVAEPHRFLETDTDVLRAIQGFDVVLVGTHLMRRSFNLAYRRAKYSIPPPPPGSDTMHVAALTPIPGERLVIRSNAHDVGLLNGDVVRVVSVEGDVRLDKRSTITMALQPLDERNQPTGRVVLGVECDVSALRQYAVDELRASPVPPRQGGPVLVDFAWSMTVHSMQGSQAPRVLVIGTSAVGQHDDLKAWRYTAASRAMEKLTYLVSR